MTVSAQTPINRSTGNGVTTVFPYTFKIISSADMEVSVDGVVKTLTVDYTLSGVGDDAGGNVTMLAAPATSTSVVRRRNMALTRNTDYQDQGELPASTLDSDLDSAVLMIQQVDEQIGRALTLSAGIVGISAELPGPVPTNLLGWSEDGSEIRNYTLEEAGVTPASSIPYTPAGAGAVATTVQGKLRESVSVLDFGAVGDGVTDDAAAFTALFATNKAWYIPYTVGGYKCSVAQTINADGVCDGFIVPTTAIGAAPVFTVADSGYGIKRSIRGLKVNGSVALRAAGLYGIRVDCPNAHLTDCSAYQLNYGIIVRMYSVTLTKCNAWQCNTNLSAYARDFSHEINALTINGGNYDSAVDVALNIGDTSWGDALAAGNSHGVVINITGGLAMDGAESRIDNCSTVNINGIYGETSNTDCIWRLGGSGDGNLANVDISGNFFKGTKYAVRCYSAIKNLTVGPNFLSAITISEVKLTSDIYGINHRKGEYAGCFGNGQVVGIAFRSVGVNALSFQAYTLETDFLINGSQNVTDYPQKWYPSAVYHNARTTVIDNNSSISSGVYYTTPSTGKAITVVSGTTVQFTTISDSYAFNGGDRITLSAGTGTYIRSVDYDLGQALIDGGTVGVGTISQAVNFPLTTSYATVVPASGAWKQGDTVANISPAVGSPKGWTCTVAGTPGTWVSEGNL